MLPIDYRQKLVSPMGLEGFKALVPRGAFPFQGVVNVARNEVLGGRRLALKAPPTRHQGGQVAGARKPRYRLNLYSIPQIGALADRLTAIEPSIGGTISARTPFLDSDVSVQTRDSSSGRPLPLGIPNPSFEEGEPMLW
jgi:hypothetical protein